MGKKIRRALPDYGYGRLTIFAMECLARMPNGVTYAHILRTLHQDLTRRKRMTKIKCDECDFMLSPATGIAAYTRNLADALVEGNEWTIIFLRFRLVREGRGVAIPALKPLGNW